MDDKPILIVHPYDKSTQFLSKIKMHLVNNFGNQVHHFNVYPDENSHNECIERIAAHKVNGLIIFLGHGRTDKLYGAKGDLFNSSDFTSTEAKNENLSAYYYNDNFINENNVEIFKQKKVFCLACNSNNKIAALAMDKGAKFFLGFGDIPTSPAEFIEHEVLNKVGQNISTISSLMRKELNYIIKKSLFLSIQKKTTSRDLLSYIHFIANQRLADLLVNQKNYKERYVLADYIYFLKKGAKILGDSNLSLID